MCFNRRALLSSKYHTQSTSCCLALAGAAYGIPLLIEEAFAESWVRLQQLPDLCFDSVHVFGHLFSVFRQLCYLLLTLLLGGLHLLFDS